MFKRMSKVIVLVVVFLSITINLFAGWTQTFGGDSVDIGHSVRQTTDGGYIITGETSSYGAGYQDLYLIKTNSNGDTLWTRIFGGSGSDIGYSVRQTTDGGYIITGMTPMSGLCVYLIKTNSNGDSLWTRTFGGANPDCGYSVQQTTDGGYIILGSTRSYGAGSADVYLIKTNSNGDSLWTRTYGGTSYDCGHSVRQTSDGGYIIAGETSSYGAGSSDFYLIKTDGNGDSLWTRTFGGISDDKGYSVQQTIDGGYIVAGYTYSFGTSSYDVYLIKTKSNGDSLWTRTFGGNDSERGYSVQQTTDGGYIITGWTESYGAGYSDVYLINTNSNGDSLWTRTFGGTDDDKGYSIQQTTDGGYIISGETWSYGADSSDVYLIKTDANGVVVEETIISTPSNFSYCINQISNKNISIQFSLPQSDRVEINIYDASGRYISTPISGNYQAGVYRVSFKTDIKGVYFFNLITDRISENGKFIIF